MWCIGASSPKFHGGFEIFSSWIKTVYKKISLKFTFFSEDSMVPSLSDICNTWLQ